MTVYDKVLEPVITKLIAELDTYQRTGKYTRPFNINNAYNVETRRDYQGINVLLLGLSTHQSPVWGTFLQWQRLGYKVTGGKGCGFAVFSPPLHKKEYDDDGNLVAEYQRPSKAYHVFNSEDVSHAESGESYTYEIKNTDQRDVVIDAFIKRVGATIKTGDYAAYSPSQDVITMPTFDEFINSNAYYSTLSHELVHWSGASHRLNRDTVVHRDTLTAKAKEELIAELGSILLGVHLKLPLDEMRQDHYEYLFSWLQALKNDRSYFRDALKEATSAVHYIKERADNQVEQHSELIDA